MFRFPAVLWLALTIGFLVLEGGTVALVSIWFAVGSAAALALALMDLPFWAQVAAFVAVSAGLLAMLRPMMRRHMKTSKTNIDSIIGSEGLVTTAIDNIAYVGEVKLGAMTWTARSTNGDSIEAGTRVRVDRIEGVKVFVSPAEVPAAK